MCMYVDIAKEIQEVSSEKESNAHSHANNVKKTGSPYRCCCKMSTFKDTCLKIMMWFTCIVTCGCCVLCTHPDHCDGGTCCNCKQCFLNDRCNNCCERIDINCKGNRCYDCCCEPEDGCCDQACSGICFFCIVINSLVYADDDC